MRAAVVRFVVALVALVAFAAIVALPKSSLAAAPAPDLMARLATHAQGFEQMKKRASYNVAGKLQELSSDNSVSATKTMKGKVVANGVEAKWDVVEYKEDGVDKTDEAKKKAKERAAENAKKKDKREFHMPFLPSEQARYTFDQKESDPADPNHVRITFVPKVKADDTIEGSAWVDVNAGTVLSAGFKLSKTPMFVDYIHITVEFGTPTSLGPAPSKLHVEGKGGVLFWNKLFKGDAWVSDYSVKP